MKTSLSAPQNTSEQSRMIATADASVVSSRVDAIDVFRGMTVAFMILVNNPGSWSHSYPPLKHASWFGWTPTDLVFPFFLFIVGVSAWFSMRKYEHRLTVWSFWKIMRRTAFIFLAGLFLTIFPGFHVDWSTLEISRSYLAEPAVIEAQRQAATTWWQHCTYWADYDTFSHLRMMGVLQRIALSYGLGCFVCLLFHGNTKRLAWAAAAILLGYWWLFYWIPTSDPLGKELNVVRMFDITLLGEDHLYGGYGLRFDPESIVGSISGAVTVILGFLVGSRLGTAIYGSDTASHSGSDTVVAAIGAGRNAPSASTRSFSIQQAVFSMLFVGPLWILLAYIWDLAFPIGKPLWTSSYVLLAGGLAAIGLAYCVWMTDVRGWKRGFYLFRAFGSNPLLMFLLAGIFAKTLLRWLYVQEWYHEFYAWLETATSPNMASLLHAITFVLFLGIIAVLLHAKRIYIRL